MGQIDVWPSAKNPRVVLGPDEVAYDGTPFERLVASVNGRNGANLQREGIPSASFENPQDLCGFGSRRRLYHVVLVSCSHPASSDGEDHVARLRP